MQKYVLVYMILQRVKEIYTNTKLHTKKVLLRNNLKKVVHFQIIKRSPIDLNYGRANFNILL